MFRKRKVDFTEEEVELLKRVAAREKRAQTKELPAIPKNTLFPGFLSQSTIIALEEEGCVVTFIDHEKGHAVATPRGARYRRFMELIRDMEPYGRYARQAWGEKLEHFA